MKIITFVLLTALFLASCASMQVFQPSDITEEGIRYKYGSKQGIAVGDTILAYKTGRRGVGVLQSPIGSLTVVRVEADYSIMKKNDEFEVNEKISFNKK